MAVDPKKLIAAISPDVYCDSVNLPSAEAAELRDKVEKALSDWKPSEIKGLSGIKTRKDAVKFVNKIGVSLKKEDPYLKSAELTKLKESDFMDFDEVIKTPFQLVGLQNPIEQHSVEYDTSSQALEQVYFWLHDYILNTKADYGNVDKMLDNFISAPGSAHF